MSSDPSNPVKEEISSAHRKRLNAAMKSVHGIADKLGKGFDDGIAPAVAMLNHFGIDTTQSCEGHDGWATGGPYIDLGCSDHYERGDKLRVALNNGTPQNELQAFQNSHAEANLANAKKIVPILEEFYKDRKTSFEDKLTFSYFDVRVARLESTGVSLLEFEQNPEIKRQKLKDFQAEMNQFTDFLITYEPKVFADQELSQKSTFKLSNIGSMLLGVLKDKPKAASDNSYRP